MAEDLVIKFLNIISIYGFEKNILILFLGCYRKASFKAHNGLEISDVFDVDLPNDGGLSGRFISYVLSVLSRIIPSLSMKANTEYSSKYLLINAYQPNLLFYLNEEKLNSAHLN